MRNTAVILSVLALVPIGALAQAAGGGLKTDADVDKLFANTCGWCHADGGREKGKGPKLMDTQLTDGEIISRVKNDKPGYMPAFGAAFKDEEIHAIVHYIRGLKPKH